VSPAVVPWEVKVLRNKISQGVDMRNSKPIIGAIVQCNILMVIKGFKWTHGPTIW